MISYSQVKETVTDAAITAKIKTKFAADDTVSALNITVETNDKKVILSGEVDDQIVAERALSIAKSTSGVQEVINKLTIH